MKQNSVWIAVAVSLCALLAALFTRADARAHLVDTWSRLSGKAATEASECESNLKRVAVALEMYSTDNAGSYPGDMRRGGRPEDQPRALERLVPGYLPALPLCPAAGENTYSKGYTTELGRIWAVDAYSVMCSGHHHRAAGYLPDFPRYDSAKGLVRDPSGDRD